MTACASAPAASRTPLSPRRAGRPPRARRLRTSLFSVLGARVDGRGGPRPLRRGRGARARGALAGGHARGARRRDPRAPSPRSARGSSAGASRARPAVVAADARRGLARRGPTTSSSSTRPFPVWEGTDRTRAAFLERAVGRRSRPAGSSAVKVPARAAHPGRTPLAAVIDRRAQGDVAYALVRAAGNAPTPDRGGRRAGPEGVSGGPSGGSTRPPEGYPLFSDAPPTPIQAGSARRVHAVRPASAQEDDEAPPQRHSTPGAGGVAVLGRGRSPDSPRAPARSVPRRLRRSARRSARAATPPTRRSASGLERLLRPEPRPRLSRRSRVIRGAGRGFSAMPPLEFVSVPIVLRSPTLAAALALARSRRRRAARAGGWWDDLDKGEPVRLSDLVAEPQARPRRRRSRSRACSARSTTSSSRTSRRSRRRSTSTSPRGSTARRCGSARRTRATSSRSSTCAATTRSATSCCAIQPFTRIEITGRVARRLPRPPLDRDPRVPHDPRDARQGRRRVREVGRRLRRARRLHARRRLLRARARRGDARGDVRAPHPQAPRRRAARSPGRDADAVLAQGGTILGGTPSPRADRPRRSTPCRRRSRTPRPASRRRRRPRSRRRRRPLRPRAGTRSRPAPSPRRERTRRPLAGPQPRAAELTTSDLPGVPYDVGRGSCPRSRAPRLRPLLRRPRLPARSPRRDRSPRSRPPRRLLLRPRLPPLRARSRNAPSRRAPRCRRLRLRPASGGPDPAPARPASPAAAPAAAQPSAPGTGVPPPPPPRVPRLSGVR